MTEILLDTRWDRRSRILVERGCLARVADEVAQHAPAPRRVAVVSDRNVASVFVEPMLESLREAGYDAKDFVLPPGEETKSLSTLGNLWDRLLAFEMDRGDVVLALGGGVIGDLAGFAASTLQRGVTLVQVPTSLLSQVDSSVGGKTGINRSAGKNLVGSFYQPALVLVDPATLDSLPEREFRAGLAEVIKYGFIRDPEILRQLEALPRLDALRDDDDAVQSLVERSIRIKAEVVAEDEREAGVRAHLNFGHTVGHALEAAGEYRELLHGEAVAVGMLAASFLAIDLEQAGPDLVARLSDLLQRYELPTTSPHGPDVVLPFLARDKKRVSGENRWILVPKPGEVLIETGPDESSVIRALDAVYAPPTPVADAAP